MCVCVCVLLVFVYLLDRFQYKHLSSQDQGPHGDQSSVPQRQTSFFEVLVRVWSKVSVVVQLKLG